MLKNQKIAPVPILLRDLGIDFPTIHSNYKARFGIYECQVCFSGFKARTPDVKSGKTKRCPDCRKYYSENKRLYRILVGMKTRCYNKNTPEYVYYGARGISICKLWNSSTKEFIEWSLKNGYEHGLSIDRINNNGNYEPDNCRFTTKIVQARNTRVLNKRNTSGYRGAIFHKGDKKWHGYITVNNVKKYLGSYDYSITAAYAYDSYVLKNNLEHNRNFL